MKRAVIFSPEARNDLDELFAYIDGRAGSAPALAYAERIRTHCLSFADFPERGTRRDDLKRGLRVIGFERRVVIAFLVGADRVVIARILYGGRDLRRALRKRR